MNAREQARLRDEVARRRAIEDDHVCAGCGAELDNQSSGCKTCSDRHGKRTLRAARPLARSHRPDGDRRQIVHALRLAGHAPAEIARLLRVSPVTVARDLEASPVDLFDEREALLARLEQLEAELERLLVRVPVRRAA